MTFDDEYISTPDAILELFKVNLSEHKEFKDLLYSFIRNRGKGDSFLNTKEVPQENTGANTRNNLFIPRNSLIKLNNAVILQAFFNDTKKVKKIFTNDKLRRKASDLIALILTDRNLILGIELQSRNAEELVKLMRSNKSLDTNRLPNPFLELPQLSLGGMTSIIQGLIAQSAALSQGHSMMDEFLNGDLECAYETSMSLQSFDFSIKKYQTLVQNKYKEAMEFEELLENLLN